ncbi:YadA-like family protein [Oligella urethralis]|uniref:YadA-like family protein n=2 Tax=Oligella urethralis TaxID=90245 RepID=UPI001788D72A|nr:YadA-like family protein [Oligella urethralis]
MVIGEKAGRIEDDFSKFNERAEEYKKVGKEKKDDPFDEKKRKEWLKTKEGNYAVARAALEGNVFLGKEAGINAFGTESVLVGADSGKKLFGYSNTMLGAFSATNLVGDNNTGVGKHAAWQLKGNENIVLGRQSGQELTGDYNLSGGTESGIKLKGNNNISLGPFSGKALVGSHNLSSGTESGRELKGNNNISLGHFSGKALVGSHNLSSGTIAGQNSKGDYNISLGYASGVELEKNYNVSVGYASGSKLKGEANVSSGVASGLGLKGDHNISSGTNAARDLKGNNNISFGYSSGNELDGDGNISSGEGSAQKLKGSNNISLGRLSGSRSQGDDNISLGNKAGYNVPGTKNIVIGNNTNSFDKRPHDMQKIEGAIAIGNDSEVRGNNSASIGNENKVLQGVTNTFVLGSEVVADVENSVYLGHQSVVGYGDAIGEPNWTADGVEGDTTTAGNEGKVDKAIFTVNGEEKEQPFTFAGAKASGAVSVGYSGGERRLQNLAAGEISATSTDAINGSQLFAVASEVYKGLNFDANTGGVQTSKLGSTVTIKGADENTDASKFDAGKNLMTSIEKQGEDSVVRIALAKDLDIDSVKAGETLLNNNGLSVGDKVKVSNTGITAGDVSLTTEGINAGGKPITNVAPGTEDTDAVNFGQLTAQAKAAKTTVAAGDGVAVDAKQLADNSTEYTVSAKTDGTTIKINDEGKIAANTTTFNTTTDGTVGTPFAPGALVTAETVQSAINNAGFNVIGAGNNADPGVAFSKELVKAGNTVTFEAGENLTLKQVGTQFTFATKKDVSFDSVKVGDVSLTTEGINAGGKPITNVAPGTEDTDAVNFGQLTAQAKAAKTTVAAGDGVAVDAKQLADNSTEYTVSAKTDGTTIKINDEGKIAANTTTFNTTTDGTVGTPFAPGALVTAETVQSAINNAGFNVIGAGNNADPGVAFSKELVKAGNTVTFEAGENLTLKQVGTQFTFATKKDVSFDSVKVGDVSLTTEGINAGGKPITNVAPGTEDTDAVNFGQLTAQAKAAKTTVAAGDGVAVDAKQLADNSTEYTVSAKTDGTTIKINDEGKIAANTTTFNTTTDGTVGTPFAPGALVTADTVQSAINNAGFNVIGAGNNADPGVAFSKELVKAGNTVTFEAGENLTLKQVGTQFTFATKKDVSFDSVKVGDVSLTTEGINAGGKPITNVAPGTEDTDAVNFGQLTAQAKAAKTTVAAGDGVAVDAKQLADNSTEYTVSAKTDGTTIKINDEGKIAANTTTFNTTTDGTVGTPFAPGALVTAETVQSAINNAGFNVIGAGNNADPGVAFSKELVKAGNTVTFEAGENLTLKQVGTQFTFATKKDVSFDSVKVGDVSLTTEGINAGGKPITNVAPGTEDTDAVNFGQLKEIEAQVKASSTKLVAGDGVTVDGGKQGDGSSQYTISAKTDGTTIKINDEGKIAANTTTFNTTTDGTVGTPFAPGALVTAETVQSAINNAGFNVIGAGNNADPGVAFSKELVKAGNTVTFEAGENLTLKQVGTQFTFATKKDVSFDSVKVGDVSLTTEGINAGGKPITNVAPGTEDTDAVNFGQLKEIEAQVKASSTKLVAGDGVTVDGGKQGDGSSQYTISAKTDGTTIQINDNGAIAANTTTFNTTTDGTVGTPVTPGALVTADTVQSAINNAGFNVIGAGNKADSGAEFSNQLVKAGNTVTFEAGDNLTLKQEGTQFTFALAKDVSFDSVSVGDVKVTNTGITVGDVSLSTEGINAGGKQITNVAAGKADTDAVNVSQLKAAVGGFNNVVNHLGNEIHRVDREARAGTASAAAMANLPQAYLPGKSMFAIAGAGHRGEHGYAAGLSTISDNGKWIIKSSVSGNTRGDVTYGAGVGYQW